MKSKYLTIASFTILLILAGGLLAGCGNKVDQVADTSDASAVVDQVPAVETPAPAPVVPQVATPTPAITEADLDLELKGLDASLDTVKTTGFEQTDLNNKDLGL